MKIKAPAKINIFLKILSKRKDGYHNIISLMQTVSLYDTIKLCKMQEKKIILKCNIPSISGKENLCYKIAKFIKTKYKIKNGIKIEINKKIPIGSGLGGASSDAATVVMGMLKMFKIKEDIDNIVTLCAQFGKDIPFFFYKGCCIVESTGEKVTKLNSLVKNKLWFVLVVPKISVSTKKVYETYDKLLKDKKIQLLNKKINIQQVKKILLSNNVKKLKQILVNDLEVATLTLYPELKKLKQILLNTSELVNMTGSGTGFYIIANSKTEAEKIKKTVENVLKKCYKFKSSKVYVVKSV